MVPGDAPFEVEYSSEVTNYYWREAGEARKQAVIDIRFINYVETDPLEAVRIPFGEIAGKDTVLKATYYYQKKYPENDSPIPVITWQENHLMLAEVALRNDDPGTALNFINEVRASHGLADLVDANMTVLMEERDKELVFTGIRLPDQRRWDDELDTWHLDEGKWMYLPITEGERNANDYLPDV